MMTVANIMRAICPNPLKDVADYLKRIWENMEEHKKHHILLENDMTWLKKEMQNQSQLLTQLVGR